MDSKGLLKFSCLASLFLFTATGAFAATQITAIDFHGGATPTLEVSANGPIQVQKTDNSQDQQVVLEIQNASIAKSVSRKLDTSSFPGPVSLVSPYTAPGGQGSRIVIQMRESVPVEMSQTDQKITLRFGVSGVTSTGDSASKLDTVPADTVSPNAASTPTSSPESATPADATAEQKTDIAPAAGTAAAGSTEKDSPETKMDQFLETRDSRQFIGRPISLQVRDADVNDILRMIGEASGFNIVIGEAVRGTLSLSLSNVPWDQVLDLVLSTMKLGAERSNNVLRIDTLANITAQRQAELQAKQAAEANAQKITRIFPISYADIADLQTSLTAFAAGRNASGQADTTSVVIRADTRTNSLIVQATPETVERVRKLIKLLDTQTPQVLIEAKVVQASENFSRNISGSLGVATMRNFASVAGGDPAADLVATASSNAGTSVLGLRPVVGFLPGVTRLNAVLTLAESESEVKVITQPRVVVLNKKAANIVQTTPIRIDVTTVNQGVTVVTPQQINANISMGVTPTVTNDGSVLLDLRLQRDVPDASGQPIVANRNINTNVIVDSGSTLVVGGIYTQDNLKSNQGLPFLRKIPLIGYFFGEKRDSNVRSELLFFVTPKILNQQDAGLENASSS